MDPIVLRPTTPRDLRFVLGTEADSDNRPFILGWSRAQHAATLDDPDFCHSIIEDAWRRRVGFLILTGLGNRHRSVELRRLVVTTKGRGIGRAALRAVEHFAFDRRHAHRLWLDVKEHNERARGLYQAEGFVVEGVLRECLRGENGFESLVVMSMLACEYRALSHRRVDAGLTGDGCGPSFADETWLETRNERSPSDRPSRPPALAVGSAPRGSRERS